MSGVAGCLNCGRGVDGPGQNFCPQCGQPTPVPRIDWHFLGHELEHSVLHMDRGILYSLKNLVLRPGHFIRDYIEGRRANHVKPFLLVAMMALMVYLVSTYIAGAGPFEATMPFGSARLSVDKERLVMAQQEGMLEWMNAHLALITFLLLPMEAAMFRLAFGRLGAVNYPEWLVIRALLMAQGFIIWVVVVLLQRWVPAAMLVTFLMMLVCGTASLMQFFRGYPKWKTLLRSMLGYLLSMLGSALVIFVLALVVGVFTAVNSASAS